MEKLIQVKDLNFGYNGRLILENISFSIEQGDYIGILGGNGTGKSTLVKLLLKILSPESGEIQLFGEKIQVFKQWYRVGYVAQNATAFNASFPATVEELVGANLFSSIGLFRLPKKKHREMIDEALKTVEMQDYGKRLIGNLSGGQQQRVFIAKALVSQPEILFLDEPTVGIDAKSEEAVYCLLGRLNKSLGITVVMVSHDISAVTIHANRLLCMSEKGILLHDPKAELTQEFMNELYGYGINLHIHKHGCKDCSKRGNV